jgi:putative phosphoribosyl transferase
MDFRDRTDAGQQLAGQLERFRGSDAVVLAVPSGGVVVGSEVAKALGLRMDVVVVRAVRLQRDPSLVLAAVAEGGEQIIDDDAVEAIEALPSELWTALGSERAELARRVELYRLRRFHVDLHGFIAIVLLDVLSDPLEAALACRVARLRGARRVVLAAPIGTADIYTDLEEHADEITLLVAPDEVGDPLAHFERFPVVSDSVVLDHLDASVERDGMPDPPLTSVDHVSDLRVEAVVMLSDGAALRGIVMLPHLATGVVVFVHGAGSDATSPRDEVVATALAEVGIASLRFDLLTEFERYRRLEIDAHTMVERLAGVIAWIRRQVDLRGLPLGLNGANSGIIGVLTLAAEPGADIVAIVSRGGRPDEFATSIHDVITPALFIVGGADESILEANRTTAMLIDAPSELSVIPGASHRFVEPGAMEMVAEITRDWFFTWMVRKHAGGAAAPAH